MNKAFVYSEVKAFLIALLGFILLALTVDYLSWQYKLVSGGFAGFGLFVSYLSGLPVGQILFFLNLIILILLFFLVDKKIGLRSAVGYFLFPILVDWISSVASLSQLSTPNFFMSAALMSLQGLVAGFAVTLFFSQKYSAGGWGALAFVIKKYFSISGPQFMFFMDILLTAFVCIFLSFQKGILLGINSVVFYLTFKYTLNYIENRHKNA